MSDGLQVHAGAAALSHTGGWTAEQVALVRQTVAKDATADEFKFFLAVCGRTGLDPFTKQVYLVKRWDSQAKRETMAIQTGIDGYRLIAQRSSEYEGQVGPWWCGPDGEWKEIWTDPNPPFAAKVGVWRKGFREPLYATARWDAYVQTKKDGGPNRFWTVMGPEQLAKCAEALALRKAFPNELSGLYTREEMQQADSEPREPSAAAVEEERDYYAELVNLCRERGLSKRGEAKAIVNAVLARTGGAPIHGNQPPASDVRWQIAVEWIEQNGWPAPAAVVVPGNSTEDLTQKLEASIGAVRERGKSPITEESSGTYFSHSVQKWLPIRTMAQPHLEAAIQKLRGSLNGLLPPDTKNEPETLDRLEAEMERRAQKNAAIERAIGVVG